MISGIVNRKKENLHENRPFEYGFEPSYLPDSRLKTKKDVRNTNKQYRILEFDEIDEHDPDVRREYFGQIEEYD